MLLALAGEVHAQWAMTVEAGEGQDVSVYGLAIKSPDLRTWDTGANSELALSALGRLNYWSAQNDAAHYSDLWDANVSALLRWQRKPDTAGVLPFVEAGFGLHFLTQTQIDSRYLGTVFQFGESLGVGARFGSRYQYEAALRIQHVSNGSISRDNEGLTYTSASVAYYW
jgi:hypothetical protein